MARPSPSIPSWCSFPCAICLCNWFRGPSARKGGLAPTSVSRMPRFHYIARNSAGQPCSGQLEARTSIDAVNRLRRQGLRIERLLEDDEITAPAAMALNASKASGPVSADSVWHRVAEPSDSDSRNEADGSRDSGLGAEDLAALAGRIAQITKSQLPLTPGLRALSQELPSKSMRRGLDELCQRLERGKRSKRRSVPKTAPSPGISAV